MAKHHASADEPRLFNESVLGSAPTDALPMLLPGASAAWAPMQIMLDYKDNACYGAMIRYERKHSFESLRRAINARFGKHENATFAKNPAMGIWRVEDARFTIQLSDSDDEDCYTALYVTLVAPGGMADKLEQLRERKPDMFRDFPIEQVLKELRDMDSE